MRSFQVVFTFDKGVGDFLVEGIFSKREDALVLAREINPDLVDNGGSLGTQEVGCAVYIVEQSKHQISEQLVQQRLAELYAPLAKLAELEAKKASVG